MEWVGKDLKHHLVSTPCCGQRHLPLPRGFGESPRRAAGNTAENGDIREDKVKLGSWKSHTCCSEN